MGNKNQPILSLRILVRKVCGLGDMILTIPWLFALREVHPGCSLHLLCHAEQGELMRRLGIVDEVFPDEGSGWHQLFSDSQGKHPLKLRPDPCQYAHVYLFSAHEDSALACALRKTIRGNVTILPARPGASETLHASTLPFRAMGMVLEERFFQGLEQNRPESREKRFFVHPGSGSNLKNWAPENFVALMEKISRLAPWASWTVLEGPSDREAVGSLCRLWKGRLEVSKPGALSFLASNLKEASLFLGNDSGVTHLAAFLGIPTLALFGPSDPRIWSPLGRRVNVASHQEDCQPCHLFGRKEECKGPCRRFPTLQEAWEALLYLGPFN